MNKEIRIEDEKPLGFITEIMTANGKKD